MRQRFDAGDWANGSFTKNAWRQIVDDYNYANKDSDGNDGVVTLQQILNRWKVLKREFHCFFNLRNKSGWGWDYERHYPVAPDNEAWMQLEACYRKIRGKTFPHFTDMEQMVGRDITRGFTATTGGHESPNTPDETRLGDDVHPPDETQIGTNTHVTSGSKRTSHTGTSGSKRCRNSCASAEEIQHVEEIKEMFSKQLVYQEKAARREYASEEIYMYAETLGRMCLELTGPHYFHIFWKLQDPNFRDLFKVAMKDDQLFYHFVRRALSDFVDGN